MKFREWTKSFGIPAAFIASWVAAVVLVATQVASPLPLQAAIEKVLAAGATQTAPVSFPTASQPVALVHGASVGSFR